MASTYIKRVDTTDGNRKVWTWSAWVKLDNTNIAGQNMFSAGGNNVDEGQFKFANNTLSFFNDYATTGRVSSSTPSRLLRDVNGWYHFVWRHKVDETSNDDRWKIYINGERLQPSDYGSPTIPNEEGVYNRFTNKQIWFGARAKAQYDSSYQYFSGLMSHIHFCDGYAYDATDFGEYDANGVWKIKTSPSVNYGTHGFFILKDGNSVTDQSGNGNDCTVGGGTLTNTEDNPSNVFATFNALAYFGKGSALENGNTRAYGDSATSNNECSFTTLTGSSGKYYAEFKIAFVGDGSFIGISDIEYTILENNDGQYRPFTIMVRSNGTLNVRGSGYGAPTTTGSWSSSYTTNDILQVAMDLDNNYFYFGKNGTWQNSGVPSSGATGTGGVAITSDKNYAFTFGGYGSSPSAYANFGNGYFGTTAVASAGTNASGIGIFEYDVPTGYTALSTKGLNL